MDALYSVEEINRLRKEINRLLSEAMSNIYLKATTITKNWHFQNFDFPGLKILSQGQLWGAPTHKNIVEF